MIIVIRLILLIALGLKYIAYEQALAYAAAYPGLAFSSVDEYCRVSRLLTNIASLSPATPSAFSNYNSDDEQDGQRSLSNYGMRSRIARVHHTRDQFRSGARLNTKSCRQSLWRMNKSGLELPYRVICALRKRHIGEPISYTLKLIGHARHKYLAEFGYSTTEPAVELPVFD